jgi:AraC-like DNA-binding protein
MVMKRAVELFVIERGPARSSFIEQTWWSRSVPEDSFLSVAAIRQIQRAESAVELLSRGVTAVDAVHQVGYADQSHLTRSLKRFFGQTPSQIAASALRQP